MNGRLSFGAAELGENEIDDNEIDELSELVLLPAASQLRGEPS